jgi:hypothetical protein
MQGGDRRSGACSEAKENAERLPDDMRVMMNRYGQRTWSMALLRLLGTGGDLAI